MDWFEGYISTSQWASGCLAPLLNAAFTEACLAVSAFHWIAHDFNAYLANKVDVNFHTR